MLRRLVLAAAPRAAAGVVAPSATLLRRGCASSAKPPADAAAVAEATKASAAAAAAGPGDSDHHGTSSSDAPPPPRRASVIEPPPVEPEAPAASADSSSSSSSGAAASSSGGAVAPTDKKAGQEGGSGSSEVAETAGEPMRWVQKPKDYRIVDEKGDWIVSEGKWHKGELAYTTPAPPNHLQARFGYNIVRVKKPQTYWQYYRQQPFFSWRHVNIIMWFSVGLIYLLTFLMKEVNALQADVMKPGQLTGKVKGKGAPNGKDMKIKFTSAENDEDMQRLQNSYLNADELAYKGNKDYVMKKIARPKEFRVQDYLRA